VAGNTSRIGDAIRETGGPSRNCPGLPAAGRVAPLAAAAGTVRSAGHRLGLERWIGMPAVRPGAWNGQSTGGDAEQTYKHRARDALGSGGLAAQLDFDSLDVARRRGPWVLRGPWRPARPRSLSGCGGMTRPACPGPRHNNTGDDAWLFNSWLMEFAGWTRRLTGGRSRGPKSHNGQTVVHPSQALGSIPSREPKLREGTSYW